MAGRQPAGAMIAAAWDWLARELDAWHADGLQADFWWRDDDAVAASAQLDRLLQVAERHGVALALATIPASLESSLADALRGNTLVSVLQHGYAHQNHAAAGQRKLELGGHHELRQSLADLRRGREILRERFGERFAAVMVPPWNRIDPAVTDALPDLGFHGISLMRVRRSAFPAPGLLQVNSHLDPVNWRHRRGFIGLYPAIAILVQHLQARRTGYRDFAEPTGILSHHLAQNDAVWKFLDDLFGFLAAHPAAVFSAAPTIWPGSIAD